MSKRILHVVSNVGHYDDPAHATGLWLSELTHAWDRFAARGFEQHIVSPKGGGSVRQLADGHVTAALRGNGHG